MAAGRNVFVFFPALYFSPPTLHDSAAHVVDWHEVYTYQNRENVDIRLKALHLCLSMATTAIFMERPSPKMEGSKKECTENEDAHHAYC